MKLITQVFEDQQIIIREYGFWNTILIYRKFNKQVNNFWDVALMWDDVDF